MCIKTPHKHAELIKAWADGATIQYRNGTDNRWFTITSYASWDEANIYRIKPEPKPDKLMDYQVEFPNWSDAPRWHQKVFCNLRLVFDGETGILKDAKVL